MRMGVIGLMTLGIGLTGCASVPRTATSEAAMIIWPGTEAGCDFENPDRYASWAISTSRTETAILRGRAEAGSARTYVVRNVQLLFAAAEGDRACLAVLRGQTSGPKDAAFGFHVRFSGSTVELSPAYARLSRPAGGARRPQTTVRIAFGSGELRNGAVQPAGQVAFGLGVVDAAGGLPASAGAGVLDLPVRTQGGVTRLVAVVEESAPGAPSTLTEALVGETLNQPSDSWETYRQPPRPGSRSR